MFGFVVGEKLQAGSERRSTASSVFGPYQAPAPAGSDSQSSASTPTKCTSIQYVEKAGEDVVKCR